MVLLVVTDMSRTVAALFLVTAAAGGLGAMWLARRADEYVSELERSRAEFRRAVVRLGDAMGASDDREALVGVTLEAAMAITAADSALFWFDRGPNVQQATGVGTEPGADRRVERGAGLVGSVASTGEPCRWPGEGIEPAPQEPGGSTALAVPLRARGRIYGVVSLHRAAGAPFSEAELDDVVGLARQAGAAIDATFLHEEARRLSLTDGLTSLWNRRQFELRMAQERERASRFGERFSVVLVDLDDFKAINDTHGHLVGDAVLVETAKRLVAHTREVDTVARFGGEEFVLLLPQTDILGAMKVAEKVRVELGSVPVAIDSGELPVTLSAGVACHPEDGDSMEALLAAADEALYAAKAAGKNRVVHIDPPEPGAATP